MVPKVRPMEGLNCNKKIPRPSRDLIVNNKTSGRSMFEVIENDPNVSEKFQKNGNRIPQSI